MRSTPMVRRSLRPLGFVGAAAALCALTPDASAQGFNNQWLSFTKDNSKLVSPIIPPTETGTEIDVHWGDLDQDGWTDLVTVRKQDFTSVGKRRNLFLKNINGVLTDSTNLVSQSTVVGDQGFLTPTNDRDVQIADFNSDGWLDFATATTISDGDPKHIGHPRVYMNLGDDVNGNWLGMRFENARFPQLFSFSNGSAQNPRFCSVATGDLTGDGFPELYFGDYDSSGAGGAGQPANADMNNRLLINNGTGSFTDGSQARMNPEMLNSAFGAASEIHDMNNDGVLDVIKQTALNPPQHVAVVYNNPANEGFFNIYQVFHNFAPYHIDVGELNNDGRLDIAVPDDNADRFRLNTGVDALGRVIWGAATTFSFLPGAPGDDGFASNNLIVDLNLDGWNESLIADVDVDIGGYARRTHIYHNRGTVPGATPVLMEERQTTGAGWLGAVGIVQADLGGTHDIAVFDLDNDTDMDMLIFRRTTTEVFINNLDPITCQQDLGFGGPGTSVLSVCGEPLTAGANATMLLTGSPASSPVFLSIGVALTPFPILGGTLASIPLTLLTLATNGSGQLVLPITGTGSPGTLYLQGLVLDLSQTELFQISNAVAVQFL